MRADGASSDVTSGEPHPVEVSLPPLIRFTPDAGGQFGDTHNVEVALLDTDGVIIAVNEAWRRFGVADGPNQARRASARPTSPLARAPQATPRPISWGPPSDRRCSADWTNRSAAPSPATVRSGCGGSR